MPSEIDMLRTLNPEPDQPSAVDIQRAIASGRRRRTLRGVGVGSVAAVTTLAVAGVAFALHPSGTTPSQNLAGDSPSGKATVTAKGDYAIPGTPGWTVPKATAPTNCTLQQLPVPGNVAQSLVSGADPTGKYIVGRSYPNGGYQVVIWTDGKGENVQIPGDDQLLQDVNSSGVAVGWTNIPEGGGKSIQQPYAYANGKVTKLKGVAEGAAHGINEAGAIAGDDDSGDALVWPSLTADPIKLPLPAGAKSASVGGIDEDGTVVGVLDNKTPYAWFADGTHRALVLPTIDGKKAVSGLVYGIRGGWVTGLANTSDNPADNPAAGVQAKKAAGVGTPVRWNLRAGKAEVFKDIKNAPYDVNGQGWEVGNDPQGRAVLATGGKTVVLPPLVASAQNPNSNIPSTVTDDGRIIGGQSDDAADVIHAVVWNCK